MQSDASKQTGDTTRLDVSMDDTATRANWLNPGTSLSGISPELLKVLEPHFEEIEFEHGAHLIRQGDPGDRLFVLVSGQVDVFSDVASAAGVAGKRHMIDKSGPGDVMGEMALLTNESRTASVVASEKVKALSLSAKKVHELTKVHPELSCLMNNVVAKRLGSVEYDALAGKLLGGFRLVRRLGKGGMAVVYEAIDPEHDELVALKMMSHQLVHDQRALEQFEREFDIVRSFDSPFIVKTHSRFAAFGSWFLVLEYCAGNPLNETVKNGPVSEQRAREIYDSIASALKYAHRLGVIHRDVKPANMIEADDGVTKLMDFGLATPLAELDESTKLCGTAFYLAPELLAGGVPSFKSDYFAFGMTMLELLTGKRSIQGGSVNQVLGQIRRWRKPNVRQLCPGIDTEFCDQIAALLDPDSTNRKSPN